MKQFQFDIKRWALLLLPTFMRKVGIKALLNALLCPVSVIHAFFFENRNRHLRCLKCNGQVCYLRGMLNDVFDMEKRRIRIEDGEAEGGWVFVWSEELSSHLLVSSLQSAWPGITLYNEILLIGNTALFRVIVPWNAKQTDWNRHLEGIINEYKLLSKKYIIEYLKDE